MAGKTSVSKTKFPFEVIKNGRVGKIYKLSNLTFKTHFRYAGKAQQNTFKTFEKAFAYLNDEFQKLDTDKANSRSQNPLNSDVKDYSELEYLLRKEGNGATMREAVSFYLAHNKNGRFIAKSFKECYETFLQHQARNNVSSPHYKTLLKHFRRFCKTFGGKEIHKITSLEIADWLNKQTNEANGLPWSAKTRTSNLGSLVGLSLFAKNTLKAIPDIGTTEFQKVRRPKKEERGEVEIYTPEEMQKLLLTSLAEDIDMIPALVAGGFEGLRPAEFHAEGLKRAALKWESFIWNDSLLHVTGQKVRSKQSRRIPLHPATIAWLAPFRELNGTIWPYAQAYTKRMITLRSKANVKSVYDGYRHSYASYRIRHLKGNLAELAAEMGNSPKEINDSYKVNVTDAEADAWFGIMPPDGYAEEIQAALDLTPKVGHF